MKICFFPQISGMLFKVSLKNLKFNAHTNIQNLNLIQNCESINNCDIISFSKLLLGCYLLLFLLHKHHFRKAWVLKAFPEGVFSFSPVFIQVLGLPAPKLLNR